MYTQNGKAVVPNYKLDFSNKYNDYSKMVEMVQKEQASDNTKFDDFKQRINEFEKINTLEEAKALAKKSFPTAQEKTTFFVGNAKCVIINREDKFRIILDTEEEMICYEFV